MDSPLIQISEMLWDKGIMINHDGKTKIITPKNLIIWNDCWEKWDWKETATKVNNSHAKLPALYHAPGITGTAIDYAVKRRMIDTLIISTGCGYDGEGPGQLPTVEKIKDIQARLGIEVIQEKSQDAVDTFNKLVSEGKHVVLMYHGTC